MFIFYWARERSNSHVIVVCIEGIVSNCNVFPWPLYICVRDQLFFAYSFQGDEMLLLIRNGCVSIQIIFFPFNLKFFFVIFHFSNRQIHTTQAHHKNYKEMVFLTKKNYNYIGLLEIKKRRFLSIFSTCLWIIKKNVWIRRDRERKKA